MATVTKSILWSKRLEKFIARVSVLAEDWGVDRDVYSYGNDKESLREWAKRQQESWTATPRGKIVFN